MIRLRPHHRWSYPEPLPLWGAPAGVRPSINDLTEQRGVEHEPAAIDGQSEYRPGIPLFSECELHTTLSWLAARHNMIAELDPFLLHS